MIRFIENPNLPEGKVRTVICGELCKELNDYFDSVGIKIITIDPNNYIDSAVKYHADMAAIHLGGRKILIDKKQVNLGKELSEIGFEVYFTECEIKGEYPRDIALNFTVLGDNIYGKIDCADSTLLELLSDLNRVNVKQGYCKCSCLIISENAVITDDESIYKVLVENAVDSLLISKGDITLPGHEYGFIGGASGKISENEVLFFGDITNHRDYKKIADFLEKYGCKIISLDFPLADFGGIIPLIEEFEI